MSSDDNLKKFVELAAESGAFVKELEALRAGGKGDDSPEFKDLYKRWKLHIAKWKQLKT